jgi:tight adherence protein C
LSALLAAAAGGFAGAGASMLALDAIRGASRLRTGSASVPLFAAATLVKVARRLGSRASPVTVGDRLAAAGQPLGIGAPEWMGLKAAATAVAGLGAAAVSGALPGRLPVVAIVAGPVAGFVAPDFWLARVVARRLQAAGRELPPMLDLLQVAVEAGASPAPALGMVGTRFTGPLAAEWRAAATSIALGIPHDAALATLSLRLPSAEVRSFADAMRRARRRGLPLGEVLARQAAAARHVERIRVRERAARAGPKIQLVVAFLLVPAVMLIVAAALVAELSSPGLALSY